MVCSSLHIICGNCGSLFTIDNEHNEKARANIEQEDGYTEVYITCENCGTEHSLSEYMEILY